MRDGLLSSRYRIGRTESARDGNCSKSWKKRGAEFTPEGICILILRATSIRVSRYVRWSFKNGVAHIQAGGGIVADSNSIGDTTSR